MEYLQYKNEQIIYYEYNNSVLNLIINGIPSIHNKPIKEALPSSERFKPYYKWNTFNTQVDMFKSEFENGFKPYYKWNTFNTP